MKKIVLILFIECLLGFTAFSQQYFNNLYKPSWAYNQIIELPDGYIISGSLFAPVNREIILTKVDFKGDTIWQKTIGAAPQVYSGGMITKIDNNNIVIVGSILDSASSKNSDGIFIKFNLSNKNIISQKRYGGAGQDVLGQIIQTADGGFMLSGTSDSQSTYGNGDFYLIKTDSLGNEKWHKTYGGNKLDECFSSTKANNGGILMSGYSNSFSSHYDVYVVKVDSLGNKQWENNYGTNQDADAGLINSLKDENFLIATAFPNGSGKIYATLIKINPKGGMIWQKDYTYGNTFAFNTAPIENNDGTVVIGAIFDPLTTSIDAGYLLKVDAVGDTIWSRTYTPRKDAPTYIYDLKPTHDGGFIFCGSGWDTAERAWVVKTDCMGNDSVHYAKQNGCCGLYSANVLSNNHTTFCTGDSVTLTTQPAYTSYAWSNGATTQSITIKQTGNYAVTITNASSCTVGILPTVVTAETLPVPIITKVGNVLSSNYSNGNQWYKDGNIISGATTQTDTIKGIGSYTVRVTNSCGAVTSAAYLVAGINQLAINSEQLLVWPNPVTTGILHIEGLKNMDVVELYNILGEKVLQSTVADTLDLASISRGIYTLVITSKNGRNIAKVVVQ